MRAYIRVITTKQVDNEVTDLQRVLEQLVEHFPQVFVGEQISPHPKGGFKLSLELAADDIQSVGEFLAEAGWRLCV